MGDAFCTHHHRCTTPLHRSTTPYIIPPQHTTLHHTTHTPQLARCVGCKASCPSWYQRPPCYGLYLELASHRKTLPAAFPASVSYACQQRSQQACAMPASSVPSKRALCLQAAFPANATYVSISSVPSKRALPAASQQACLMPASSVPSKRDVRTCQHMFSHRNSIV